jgi:outer membrane protein
MLLLTMPAAARAQEPRRVTFDEAVTIALRQSSAIARAENQSALADLAVSDARMRFLPDLRASTSGSQGIGGSGLSNDPSRSLSTRLSSSVTLFDGFSNVAGLKSAELERDAGGLDAERTKQDVVFSVISGYLSVIEAGEQLKVAEENLAAQQDRERDVNVLVERGSRPIADLYQQQAAVAAARSVVVEAKRAVEIARLELVQSLRLEPTAAYVFEAPALPEPSAATGELNVNALVTQALAQRVDLEAMETRVAAADQGVRAAKGSRYPTVSLSAGYGANYSSAANLGFGDQLDASRGGSVGLSLSFPLFDGLSASREIERAGVQAENARLAAEDLRRQVATEVQRAVLDRDAAAASLDAAVARVTASRQALGATEARYDAGVATLFEVTQARADFVDATSAEVRARYTLTFQDRVLDYYAGTLDASSPLSS